MSDVDVLCFVTSIYFDFSVELLQFASKFSDDHDLLSMYSLSRSQTGCDEKIQPSTQSSC